VAGTVTALPPAPRPGPGRWPPGPHFSAARNL